MELRELYGTLKEKFSRLIQEREITRDPIGIRFRALSPREAIGDTEKKDYPILTGKEVMIQAEYRGALGQAFTDSPSEFEGALQDILELDIGRDRRGLALFTASVNAVCRFLFPEIRTVHCRDDGPELCAAQFVEEIKKTYGKPRVALVGFQPALAEALGKTFDLRVLDLNPENIGKMKRGLRVGHGLDDYAEVVRDWAELVLCTGSTLTNGTIDRYLDLDKEVIFFGTTISGAARLLGLRRLCFCSL